ncbi:MAG: amidohydrolase family protein [Gammaproteobacteria bacterium]|nr:amidohydrolase family protein [Gammaproteobacteria bacterium]
MWIRKSDHDRETGRATPVPTQIVGNEEFEPMPQTPDQQRVERRIFELADHYSRKLGMSRRTFLRTSGGMAVSFMAMNEVFGPAFLVSEAEAAEPAARREMWPKNEFILDLQTHHVKDSMAGPTVFRSLTGKFGLNPVLSGAAPAKDSLHRANYVKEIFFDSDTVMACLTGAAIGPPDKYVLSADDIVATRNLVNEAAGSRRMLAHGIGTVANPGWLEEAERQVRELKIDAWKFYTGDPVQPWRHDDEKLAYPFYEKTLKLGVRNICTHKGLPLPGPGADYFRPDDVLQAAKDWPDLNFIVFHSGMKHMMTMLPPGESGIDESGDIPWTTAFCAQIRAAGLKNIYLELGAVFGHSVVTHPEVCGHLLGQLIAAVGADHVIWGTDSIWWGSPQWQIEAFRRFQIPESLQEKFGYKPLSARDRELILGLNAARLFAIDVQEARKAIPEDALSRMKVAYQAAGEEPSITQYGWIAAV